LGKPRKGRINVTASGGVQDFDLVPDGHGRSLNVRDEGLCEGEVGIDQHANAHGSRLQLMQQSKLLCSKLSNDKRDTGDIDANRMKNTKSRAFLAVSGRSNQAAGDRVKALGGRYVARTDSITAIDGTPAFGLLLARISRSG
jgi:hypothetical protein